MVKIGFIVEGASEKKLLETSQNFRDFFAKCGFELVKVQDAKGGGNLLPEYMDSHLAEFANLGVEKLFVLTDLEDDPCAENVRKRISHEKIEFIFIAIKALEAWYLADSQAMCNFLQISQSHEEYPEQTQDKPWERIREIINEKSVRGVGSKLICANRMAKYWDFSIERAAQHPNCPSAKEFVQYFNPSAQ